MAVAPDDRDLLTKLNEDSPIVQRSDVKRFDRSCRLTFSAHSDDPARPQAFLGTPQAVAIQTLGARHVPDGDFASSRDDPLTPLTARTGRRYTDSGPGQVRWLAFHPRHTAIRTDGLARWPNIVGARSHCRRSRCREHAGPHLPTLSQRS